MKKILTIFLLVFLVFSLVFVTTGCTISEEKDHGTFSTKKTTTKLTEKGIQKETKKCPFWNRDC